MLGCARPTSRGRSSLLVLTAVNARLAALVLDVTLAVHGASANCLYVVCPNGRSREHACGDHRVRACFRIVSLVANGSRRLWSAGRSRAGRHDRRDAVTYSTEALPHEVRGNIQKDTLVGIIRRDHLYRL